MISGAICILADYRQRHIGVYIFKPLTLLSVIIIVWTAGRPSPASYKYGILAGLGLSLLGDIFMMLPKKKFQEGLAAFLGAHIGYIVAFSAGLKASLKFWPLIAFLTPSFFMLFRLSPNLQKMKIPVSVYLLVITVMAWLSLERHLQFQTTKTAFALAGACLFLVSDSVLAENRFIRKFEAAQALILSTYFPAQLLIGLSV
jgi:uncharacterized membrane protein YhhN